MADNLALLAPAAVLALWTLIMLLWTAATRFPAMSKLGMSASTARAGGRGQDLDGVLPPEVQWKSHNYTHLLEQPTLFYAIVLILFVGGGTTALTVGLAWAYTALRVVHSIWQATINTIPVRFSIFVASTVVLLVLTVMAVILTLA